MSLHTRPRRHSGSARLTVALICAATATVTCARNTTLASGDADADFVAAMIPHHQGAIDMAKDELRHGRNEQLRRLAQEIIVTQQQEITAMRLALGQPPSELIHTHEEQ